MPKHDSLIPAREHDPETAERLSKICAALEFLKDVAGECHAGNLKLDGVGLSAVFGLLSDEADRAAERQRTLEHQASTSRRFAGGRHT